MPIYEYKCPNCGVVEREERITDERLQVCPTCGAKVKKLISNVGVIFKGPGFYVTDNRNGSSHGKDGGTTKAADTK